MFYCQKHQIKYYLATYEIQEESIHEQYQG